MASLVSYFCTPQFALSSIHCQLFSKLYYESAVNNTVKGFDCVHVVGPIDNLELWLGEVKFYKSITAAISDVITEIDEHLKADFLRRELVLIGNKLDERDGYTAAVHQLLSERTSLDAIFSRVCIPVLLTYESSTVERHTAVTEEYVLQFCDEVAQHFRLFLEKAKTLPPIRIHLFLLPLDDKAKLIAALHAKLKAWQEI